MVAAALRPYWPRFLAALCLTIFAAVAAAQPATIDLDSPTPQDFDAGWRFFLGDPLLADDPAFEDGDWRALDLPHDWSIEGPIVKDSPLRAHGGFHLGGVGWYRKSFDLPDGAAGKRFTIQFDGVYHHSDVIVNGQRLGHWPYGYSTFRHDLTPHLKAGRNVLAVRVDNSDGLNSRWYSGSGIYRHVWLTVTDPLHIERWGLSVTTPDVSRRRAMVLVRGTVVNNRPESADCKLTVDILGPDGAPIAGVATQRPADANSAWDFEQGIRIDDPQRWSPETPTLYTARVTLEHAGDPVDVVEVPFGIRSIEWDARKGFLLNGEQVKLKGVCLHHDLGPLGAAYNDRAMERRLEILKSIGCNAIRTAHNPPAPQLLDLCDRMGFLVIDEAFDKWDGRFYAAGTDIEIWGRRDLEAMILRDRNHPSVVLWSVGNELQKQGEPEFYATLQMLAGHTRRLDPTRPVSVALKPVSGETMDEALQIVLKTGELVDVVGLNYMEHHVDAVHELNPKLRMYSSESYCFFYPGGMDTRAYLPRNTWWDVPRKDHLPGQFIWAGIEYLGESWRWPEIGWGDAPIDICGFLKPQAYWRRAAWTDAPTVHIAVEDPSADMVGSGQVWSWPRLVDHWTLPHFTNNVVRLYTFTNCEEVELFQDGKSKGVKKLADFPSRMIEWWLPYGEGGTVRAVGRNAGPDGGSGGGMVEVAVHELTTAKEAAKIELTVDRAAIAADGVDQAYVTARVLDADGNLVPNPAVTLNFRLDGPGRLAAVGSGNLKDHTPFASPSRATYQGRALAIVQAGRAPATLRLTAWSDTPLPPATLEIRVGE
jgi:beta-galactosidase